MFRLVVLPCFDLCRSNSVHVGDGGGGRVGGRESGLCST